MRGVPRTSSEPPRTPEPAGAGRALGVGPRRPRGLRKLAQSFARHKWLFARDLAEPLPEVDCPLAGRLQRLAESDAAAYTAFYPRARTQTYLERLAAGQRVYAMLCEGRIAATAWVSIASAEFPGIGARWRLGADEVYLWDSFTAPESRGQNLGTLRAVEMLRALRAEGFRRAYCFVLPDNQAGLGPPHKAGYARIGSIGWIGFHRRGRYYLRIAGQPTRWRWRWSSRRVEF